MKKSCVFGLMVVLLLITGFVNTGQMQVNTGQPQPAAITATIDTGQNIALSNAQDEMVLFNANFITATAVEENMATQAVTMNYGEAKCSGAIEVNHPDKALMMATVAAEEKTQGRCSHLMV